MPINRSAPTPQFIDYITRYGLIDPATNAVPAALGPVAAVVRPFRIPTFQRGISWDVDQVREFLASDSVLLGHVIITKIQQQQAGELVDGLQRFAVGTALLNSLWPLVMAPTPQSPMHQHLFAVLAQLCAPFQTVFGQNHLSLMNHPRQAIQTQYAEFYAEIDAYIRRTIASGNIADIQNLATSIERCFIQRQIAIDDFTGFQAATEIVNTFLGINTIRVELSTVDLVRTYIVDHAERHPVQWTSTQIAQSENEITDTFTDHGVPRKEILPLATVAQKMLSGGLAAATHLFPTWGTGSNPQEVAAFLDFVEQGLVSAPNNTYTREIMHCGALPFSILLLHFYGAFLKNGGARPAFFTGSHTQDSELRNFLRATYRSLIAGTLGQLGTIAERTVTPGYAALADVANDINSTTGAGGLAGQATAGWIHAQLLNVNKEKAKRMFNACLLPLLTAGPGGFVPLTFGRVQNDWQIDHLIPDRALNKGSTGFLEGQRIQNFAPLPSQFNKAASNTPCSQKLKANGVYPAAIAGGAQHPYLQWLVTNQGALAAALDNQQLLLPNSTPPVGDGRVTQLERYLETRI